MSELIHTEPKALPQIYLAIPVELFGVKVTHTREGLEYLIEHYTKMLTMNPVNVSVGKARSQKDEDYMKSLITNWTWHLELYKKEEAQQKGR
jgi:hypothetical protein